MVSGETGQTMGERVDGILLESVRSGRISWRDAETVGEYIRQLREERRRDAPRACTIASTESIQA